MSNINFAYMFFMESAWSLPFKHMRKVEGLVASLRAPRRNTNKPKLINVVDALTL
jgi:hypothetical protein